MIKRKKYSFGEFYTSGIIKPKEIVDRIGYKKSLESDIHLKLGYSDVEIINSTDDIEKLSKFYNFFYLFNYIKNKKVLVDFMNSEQYIDKAKELDSKELERYGIYLVRGKFNYRPSWFFGDNHNRDNRISLL